MLDGPPHGVGSLKYASVSLPITQLYGKRPGGDVDERTSVYHLCTGIGRAVLMIRVEENDVAPSEVRHIYLPLLSKHQGDGLHASLAFSKVQNP